MPLRQIKLYSDTTSLPPTSPDIVVWFDAKKTLYMIELNVCFKTCFDKASEKEMILEENDIARLSYRWDV